MESILVERAIRDFLPSTATANWNEIALTLARYGRSELEDCRSGALSDSRPPRRATCNLPVPAERRLLLSSLPIELTWS